MAGNPLVIIDVQPGLFPAARHEPLLSAIAIEITCAQQRQDPIIFLEYFWKEYRLEKIQSDVRLLKLAGPSAIRLYKYTQDGAKVLKSFCLKQFGYLPSLRIVGVNTDQCVLSTVTTWSKISPKPVTVNSTGCWSRYDHQFGLMNLRSLPKVTVI